jgi:(2R)-sulfolactate sulfo-lyase subunit alpha
MMLMTAPVILLHPEDNVVVCRRTVLAGERVVVEGAVDFVAAQHIDVGHKIARVALPSGAKVIKYGTPIGSTTAAVAAGAWVHLHNMKSDYISAHTRTATGDEQ